MIISEQTIKQIGYTINKVILILRSPAPAVFLSQRQYSGKIENN